MRRTPISIMALMVLASVPCAAQAQQRTTLLFKNDVGSSVYVLPDTVEKYGPAITAWTRVDAAPTDPSEVRVIAQKAIYDCEARAITILRREQYDRSGRRSSVTIIAPEDLRTVRPEQGRPDQWTLDILCGLFPPR